jgi:hypothetical protein
MIESIEPELNKFTAGKLSWPALKMYLVNHDWSQGTPKPAGGINNVQRYWDADDVNDVTEPGTWGELLDAVDSGVLTEAQFDEVETAVMTKVQHRNPGRDLL